MTIYRTSGNYHKGIKEFEIEEVIDNKSFRYKKEDRIVTGTFIPKYGSHQPYFFLTYEEAKVHLTDRIRKKIKELDNHKKNALDALNAL
jgi:hypothetical protein